MSHRIDIWKLREELEEILRDKTNVAFIENPKLNPIKGTYFLKPEYAKNFVQVLKAFIKTCKIFMTNETLAHAIPGVEGGPLWEIWSLCKEKQTNSPVADNEVSTMEELCRDWGAGISEAPFFVRTCIFGMGVLRLRYLAHTDVFSTFEDFLLRVPDEITKTTFTDAETRDLEWAFEFVVGELISSLFNRYQENFAALRELHEGLVAVEKDLQARILSFAMGTSHKQLGKGCNYLREINEDVLRIISRELVRERLSVE